MEISPADRRRIAALSLFLASVVAGIGFAAAAALFVLGKSEVACGILLGHGLALFCGLSWILGAVATFDGPFLRFQKATIGLAPVRLFVVAGGAFAALWWGRHIFDPAAIGLSFVFSQTLLHVAQAVCFVQLTDAGSPEHRRTRFFGGARLFR